MRLPRFTRQTFLVLATLIAIFSPVWLDAYQDWQAQRALSPEVREALQWLEQAEASSPRWNLDTFPATDERTGWKYDPTAETAQDFTRNSPITTGPQAFPSDLTP